MRAYRKSILRIQSGNRTVFAYRNAHTRKQILGIHPVSEHKCWIIGKFNIHYCDITAEDSENHPISIRPVFSVSSDKLSSSEITAYTLSDDFSTLYFTNTSSQLIAFDLASRKKKVCFDIKGLTQDIHNILDLKITYGLVLPLKVYTG